jgi:flagellar capping protein FliD
VVKTLFADEATGVAVQLNAYLEKTAGEDGALGVKQDNLTKESARIDAQIADLERRLEAERQQLIERFIVMETAQANINRQLQFLAQGLAGIPTS